MYLLLSLEDMLDYRMELQMRSLSTVGNRLWLLDRLNQSSAVEFSEIFFSFYRCSSKLRKEIGFLKGAVCSKDFE